MRFSTMKYCHFSIFLLFIILFVNVTNGAFCPSEEVTYPCKCNGGSITCYEPTNRLKPIFTRLSSAGQNQNKTFSGVYSEYTGITELEEDVFVDITFERLHFFEPKLTRIHTNAFRSSINTMKELYFWLSPDIASYGQEFDALKAFGSLVNLERLYFSFNGPLPDNAFTKSLATKIVQSKLWQIIFMDNTKIPYVGDYVFYHMTGLTNLDLMNHQIEYVSRHAFDFSAPLSQHLYLDLENNFLNATSFQTETFLHAQRPIKLRLGGNRIEYLNENVFLAFLLTNNQNELYVNGNPIICDCRMFWLFLRKATLQSQVDNFKCSVGVNFWDKPATDFVDCYGHK